MIFKIDVLCVKCKFREFHKKTRVLESLLNKVENTCFYTTPPVAASELWNINNTNKSKDNSPKKENR